MIKNYEASVDRLSEITAKLEKGGISLEETLKLFAEGTKIISDCNEYLDAAEQKITELTKEEKSKS